MRETLAKAREIMRANGRRVAGDRRVLLVGLGMPLLLMVLVGSLFNSGRGRVTIGVASGGSGALGTDLVHALGRSPVLKVRKESSLTAAVNDLRRGIVLVAMDIPPGYDATVRAGGDEQIIVKGQLGQTASSEGLVAVTQVVDAESDAILAARKANAPLGSTLEVGSVPAVGVETVAPTKSGVDLETPSASPYSYTTPSNLVLFVFIISFVLNVAVVADRRNGVTRRILATPTRAASMIIARFAVGFGAGLSQSIALLGMGALIFGVRWGDPFAVVALVVTTCLTAAAFGTILGTFLRNEDQVVAVGVPLALVMGMLGGCMWPLAIVGPLMREVGHISPTAWAMDGFITVIYGHGNFAGVWRDIAVLSAFAVGSLVIATARLRRSAYT